jgi:hypothetical protein
MKRGIMTMNESLPVEIKIFTDEMEKYMLKYFDNLSKNKIEEAKESEKAYRDSVIELIKWHYSQNPNPERLNEVKEVLAVNLYRLQELRNLIEEDKSIQETKLKFVELGII